MNERIVSMHRVVPDAREIIIAVKLLLETEYRQRDHLSQIDYGQIPTAKADGLGNG